MKATNVPTSKAKTAYGLLSEIATLALAEPKRIRMGIYIDTKTGANGFPPCIGVRGWPACGTVGCIAGWTRTLLKLQSHDRGIGIAAAEALGLNDAQHGELFNPRTLTDADDQGTTQHARATVRHIRRFQKQYKAQLLAKKV